MFNDYPKGVDMIIEMSIFLSKSKKLRQSSLYGNIKFYGQNCMKKDIANIRAILSVIETTSLLTE